MNAKQDLASVSQVSSKPTSPSYSLMENDESKINLDQPGLHLLVNEVKDNNDDN